MNKIPELNPIEKKLKQFYRKSKERMLDVPCTRDEIMDVLLSSYTAMPDKNITQSLKTQTDFYSGKHGCLFCPSRSIYTGILAQS